MNKRNKPEQRSQVFLRDVEGNVGDVEIARLPQVFGRGDGDFERLGAALYAVESFDGGDAVEGILKVDEAKGQRFLVILAS